MLALERVDHRRWKTSTYLTRRGYVVPAGYVTDLASVPRIFQGMMPASGSYTVAAVVHDYLCTRWDTAYKLLGKSVANRMACRIKADRVFREIMEDEGVPFLTRWTMWGAVRANSIKRGGGVNREDFKLIPVALGPGLLVLIGGVLAAAPLAVFWLGNRIAGLVDKHSK